MGGTGLALALVGILSMFNNRPIIVGVVTLGYATLGICSSWPALLVGHKRPFRRSADDRVGGAVAGTIAAILVAVLAARHEPRESPVHFLVPRQALAGHADLLHVSRLASGSSASSGSAPFSALSALSLVALPQAIRHPLSGGIIAAGLAGLFQELIRPILANSSVTKPIHDLLYTYTGLKLQGAIIIFVVAAVAIVIRDLTREEMSSRFNHLHARYPAKPCAGFASPPLRSSPRCFRSMPAISLARSC